LLKENCDKHGVAYMGTPSKIKL